MTLPRARVVAVMVGGVEYLARRGKPGQPFDAFGPDYSTIMEPVARWMVIPEAEMARREHRVLEEFPTPSLTELVGGAPAFRASIREPRPGEEHLAGVFAYRDRSGGWRVVSESDGSPWSMVYTLEMLGRVMLDPASVVPLAPREVTA